MKAGMEIGTPRFRLTFPVSLAIILLMLALFTCSEPETYSIEPKIERANVIFIEGEQSVDTLEIMFIYTDGDKDVGLDHSNPAHGLPPFHEATYFLRSTGAPVTSDRKELGEIQNEELISYADRETPPFDTLPPLSSCLYDNDRLYRLRNPDHFNLKIDFFRKDGSGTYVYLNFEEQCIFLDTRIPTLGMNNPVFKMKPLNSKRIEVVYKLVSSQLRSIFGGANYRVGLQIKDRNLNKSNYFESEEFVIP